MKLLESRQLLQTDMVSFLAYCCVVFAEIFLCVLWNTWMIMLAILSAFIVKWS